VIRDRLLDVDEGEAQAARLLPDRLADVGSGPARDPGEAIVVPDARQVGDHDLASPLRRHGLCPREDRAEELDAAVVDEGTRPGPELPEQPTEPLQLEDRADSFEARPLPRQAVLRRSKLVRPLEAAVEQLLQARIDLRAPLEQVLGESGLEVAHQER